MYDKQAILAIFFHFFHVSPCHNMVPVHLNTLGSVMSRKITYPGRSLHGVGQTRVNNILLRGTLQRNHTVNIRKDTLETVCVQDLYSKINVITCDGHLSF